MLERLTNIHKAFSVQALVLSGILPFLWPILEAASNGILGDAAKPWASLIVAAAGIFGWAVPQASVSGKGKAK